MSFSLGGPRLGYIHPCSESRKENVNENEKQEAETNSTTATNSPSFSGTSRQLFSAEKVSITPRHPRPRLHSSPSPEGLKIRVGGEEDLSRSSLRKSVNRGFAKRKESGGGENASGWALLDAKAPLVATSRSKPSRKTAEFSAAFALGEGQSDVSRRSTHGGGEFPLHHRRSTAKPAKRRDSHDCIFEEEEVYQTDIPAQKEESGGGVGEILIRGGEGDGMDRESDAYHTDTNMAKKTFHSSTREGKYIRESHSSNSAQKEGDGAPEISSSTAKGASLTTPRESSSPRNKLVTVGGTAKSSCSMNVSKLFSFSTIPLSPNSIRYPLHNNMRRRGSAEITVPLSPSTPRAHMPRPASALHDHHRKSSQSDYSISTTPNTVKRRPMSAHARIVASGGVTTCAAGWPDELSCLPLSLAGTSWSSALGHACPSPRPPSSCPVKSVALSPSVNAMKWRSLSRRPPETARAATAAADTGLNGGVSFFVQSDGEGTQVTNTTPAMIVGSSLLSAQKSPLKPEVARADEAGGGNEKARLRPTPTPATFRTPKEYAVQFPGAILAPRPRQKYKSRTNLNGKQNSVTVDNHQQHNKEKDQSEIPRSGTAHPPSSNNGVNSSRVARVSTPNSAAGGRRLTASARRESSIAATRASTSISPPRGSSLYAVSNVYVRSSSSIAPDPEVDHFRYWLTSDGVPNESAGVASSSQRGASRFSMTEVEEREADKEEGGHETDRGEHMAPERGEGRKSVAFTEIVNREEAAAVRLGHSSVVVPPTPPPFPSPPAARVGGQLANAAKKQSCVRVPVTVVTFGASFRDGLVQVGTTASGETYFSAVSSSSMRKGRDASLCYSQARGREAIDFTGARRKVGSPDPTWHVDNNERNEDAATPQIIPVPSFRKPN